MIQQADVQELYACRFETVHRIFEEYGIPRAVWSFRNVDFRHCHLCRDAIREQLLPLLKTCVHKEHICGFFDKFFCRQGKNLQAYFRMARVFHAVCNEICRKDVGQHRTEIARQCVVKFFVYENKKRSEYLRVSRAFFVKYDGKFGKQMRVQ